MDESVRVRVRDEFRHLSSVYFNAAYFGPSPARARVSMMRAVERELDPSFYPYRDWRFLQDRRRADLARLLRVPEHQVAHHTSVTEAIAGLANYLPLSADDVVVGLEGEYPSNVLPWQFAAQRRGFRHHLVAPLGITTEAELVARLPDRTRVLNISYVSFNTGRLWRLPELGALLRPRGITLVVDVTQALGGLDLTPADIAACDVVCGASYKWLLGPYGHGFAYYSAAVLDRLDGAQGSWLNSVNAEAAEDLVRYTTNTRPQALRFDRGQAPAMLTMAALEGAVDFLTEFGLSAIERHNRALSDHFLEHFPREAYDVVTPLDRRGTILCLRGRGVDSARLESALRERNIDVSVREGNLRLSFHVYNEVAQVDLLVEALRAATIR